MAVGSVEGLYNIWGETVRIAVSLADTAEPGTIQASEATYDLLREECVFRRRGAFFVDQIGEMTTFTLRGRL
jgi:class 3 adenylate cyclase